MFPTKKKTDFAVIGLGRFGRAVAKTLAQNRFNVLVVDRDSQRVQQVADIFADAVVIDSTNEEALRALDIASFDTVIVAIGSDFESNLITTVALKSLGVRRVICKALTSRQKDILMRVGADQVIQPEADAGRRLALELAVPNLLDEIPLGDSHSVLELRVPASFVGQTLAQADLRNRYGANVVAVKHENSVTISPPASCLLAANDVIVIIGKTEKIQSLTELA